MELQYYKVQKFKKDVMDCKYNEGCRCNRYQRAMCHRCGWNPRVAKARMDRILDQRRAAEV